MIERRPASRLERPLPLKEKRMTTATKKQHTATTLDHLQHAATELDKARGQATHDVVHNIDAALTRIREAAADVRHRATDQAADWQETLEGAGDDLRVELGRRGVRAQSSPEALKELAGEIRKRQAELAA
jgi:hypothetical protein